MVEFRLLGAVNLVGVDGREVRSILSQPKRVALLAYLASATPRGFHRRDSLVALFWPELDQERARAALRQALHGLRRSLGDAAIESRGTDELRIDDQNVWLDAVAFDQAVDSGRHAEALELYRGDLLSGFFISGAPEFERWLEDQRTRLRRRAVAAAWTLAGTHRDAGDVSLAVHWARHAASLVRDDEEALRRLIALLGDLGDRAGALQAYESFARRLSQEYEADPAVETRALIADVRSREGGPVTARPLKPEPTALTEPSVQIPDVAGQFSTSLDDPARVDEPPPPSDADIGQSPSVAAISGRHRGFAISGLAIVVVGVSIGAALLSGNTSAPLDHARVVVAPVSNRTGNLALDPVADLAREEIMRGLSLTEVVEVADPGALPRDPSAGSTNGADDETARALALATRSGLSVVGWIDSRGERIEFGARIVDQQSGKILRALAPVVGDPQDPRPALTTLRDRIMVVVTEAVDPRLGASASASTTTPSYEAYAAFITGVGIWYDGRNGRDALPHFKRAAVLDSTFALPMIWAAWVHQTFGQCDSTEAIAARLARLELPRLEQLQVERQMARCRGDLPAAYRHAHALARARPHSEVWQEQLARDALNFNRPREAAAILEGLHPERGALRERASYYNWLTNARHLLGEHDRELVTALQGRQRFPGNLATWRTELIALAALGRGQEVVRRLDEIDGLSPDPLRRKPTVLREIALDLAAHGDDASSKAALMRTLAWHAAQSPGDEATEFNRFERALAYHAAGYADSARTIASHLVESAPEDERYVGLLGAVLAQLGDTAAARGIATRLDGVSRKYDRGQATYWRACIAARIGERDEAVALLRRALAEGYVFNGFFFLGAHLEPSFAGLRGYKPFAKLLEPQG